MAGAPHRVDWVLDNAGPTVGIEDVAKCFGIARATAYELARRDELGVRVLRLGRRLRVPASDLRRVLGIEGDAR